MARARPKNVDVRLCESWGTIRPKNPTNDVVETCIVKVACGGNRASYTEALSAHSINLLCSPSHAVSHRRCRPCGCEIEACMSNHDHSPKKRTARHKRSCKKSKQTSGVIGTWSNTFSNEFSLQSDQAQETPQTPATLQVERDSELLDNWVARYHTT